MPPPAPLAAERRPLAWFRPDEAELARHADPDAVARLGRDLLKNGQLQAVAATIAGRMIFGHGRYLAARAAGLEALEVKVYPDALTDTEFRLIRAAENLQRADLTPHRKWLLGTELLCGNPGWRLQDLADQLNLDPSTVTRWMSPSRCTSAWQDALKDGRVGISDCYAASKLATPAEQDELLALKLGGASRDALEEAGRTARRRAAAPPAAAARLARVRCPLASGAVVVVSGPEMTLDGLTDALQQALDAAKKAGRDALDVRTAERVWRDRARRPG